MVTPLPQQEFLHQDPLEEAHPAEAAEPAWEMTREMFATLTECIQRQYVHEAQIYQLAKRLWPNEPLMEEEDLSYPLMKAALEKEWEQWEIDNPEYTRGGHTVHPTTVKSEELLKVQPDWRKGLKITNKL